MMKTQSRRGFASWVVLLLVDLVLVFPARFFQTYSIHFLNVKSNINVNYLNLVDLALLLIAVLCCISSRKMAISKKQIRIAGCYFLIVLVFSFGLIVVGKAEFISELISKTLLLCCAIIIANYIIEKFTSKQLIIVFLLPLIVLIISSFFLTSYESYGATRRPGAIGFGSNETAMFGCVLLFILLFKKNINIWIRVIFSVACLASFFVVASRRGIVIAAALIILKVLIWLISSKKATAKTIIRLWIVVALLIGLALAFKERIKTFLDSSALVLRFVHTFENSDYFAIGDRASIFSDGFDYLSNHLLLGSYGCDILFAQGSRTHTHNIFLQIIVTYGVIFGSIISWFLLKTFYRAVRYCISKNGSERELFVPCAFIVMVFICEQVGYVLWNPKAFFWIAFAAVLINEKCRVSLRSKEEYKRSNFSIAYNS